MTIKITRRQAAWLAQQTDEQLAVQWLAVGAACWVKSGPYKGCVTRRAIRLSDQLLWEAARRTITLPVEGETLADWSERHARSAA